MGTLTYTNHRFYFDASNCTEALEAKHAGLKLDTSRWVTRSFDKARVLRRFADQGAERKLKRYFITDFAPPEFISYPDHLEPMPHQVESAWHCLTRSPAYCADEAGLGKTITAALVINSDPGKTLIICPPYLKYNWKDEIDKWCPKSVSDQVFILPDSQLLFPNSIAWLKEQFPFKRIIVDEFHRFKTEDTKRTKALLDGKMGSIYDMAEKFVMLSGTPIPNGKPIELYPSLSSVAPESIKHRDVITFGKEFCGGKLLTRREGVRAVTNWDFSGATNLKHLGDELQSKLMIRHTKAQCLKDLPPKTRRLIFLDLPKKIEKLEIKTLKHIELSDIMEDNYDLGDLATYRREVGVAKIKPAFEYIKNLLEDPKKKIVVSAVHIEVVETLWKLLNESGMRALKIRGGIDAKLKAKVVKMFQTDPKIRIIVGNTLSMGLGNTLTASSHGVSVEPEWAPGVNEQMEDRIHRISQNGNVIWDYLVLRNSLDERILRQVLKKEVRIQKTMKPRKKK